MPIYEYECKDCCHCFEELMLTASDPTPSCPQCQCADVEKLMSVSFGRPQGIPSGSGGFKEPPCKPSG